MNILRIWKFDGKMFEARVPGTARGALRIVAGGAITPIEPVAIDCIRLCHCGGGRFPQILLVAVLLGVCCVQALEIGYKVCAAWIAKEKTICRHDGSTADLGRIVEM